jgi:adenine/guanine phosphoribosyltransferase-like PRPP-binding protein
MQVDVGLMDLCGHGTTNTNREGLIPINQSPNDSQPNKNTALADRFQDSGVTLVLTAQTSGVLPAQACARYLEKPMIFAREKKPITMGASYEVRYRHSGLTYVDLPFFLILPVR